MSRWVGFHTAKVSLAEATQPPSASRRALETLHRQCRNRQSPWAQGEGGKRLDGRCAGGLGWAVLAGWLAGWSGLLGWACWVALGGSVVVLGGLGDKNRFRCTYTSVVSFYRQYFPDTLEACPLQLAFNHHFAKLGIGPSMMAIGK